MRQRAPSEPWTTPTTTSTASSSNVASGSNYSHTYTYSAIGNILSGSAGTYSYTVATSSYANPHAVASIATSTTTNYSYDTNGNLTAVSQGTSTLSAHTWDYRNRMTQSTGSATSTYAYDSMGQRIKLTVGTSTTVYPTGGYNVTGSSTVKQIMANGILLGTVEKNGTSTAVTRYVLNDHLGGTNLMTDSSNAIVQTIDYFPYGATRVKSGTDVSQREYIGQFYDEASQLSYLNARYYEGSRGQFLSQDPVFLENPTKQDLQDPQSLNSYGYANGNPITNKDATGRQFTDFNVAFTVPVYGVSVGPTGGLLVPTNGSEPYFYFGTAVTDRPGPSFSAVYSPEGSPSEGWGWSASGFARGVGVQGGSSRDANGNIQPSVAPGIGTRGLSGNIFYAMPFGALFGPFENVTTPMFAFNHNPPYIRFSGTSVMLLQQPALANPSLTNRSSGGGRLGGGGGGVTIALSSASAYLSAASQAISAGNYVAANAYLSGASAALGSIR